jgi:hypothetical protein
VQEALPRRPKQKEDLNSYQAWQQNFLFFLKLSSARALMYGMVCILE